VGVCPQNTESACLGSRATRSHYIRDTMKIEGRSPRLILLVCAVVLTAATAGALGRHSGSRGGSRERTEANVTRLTASLLAGSQFSHHPLDEQMAAKLLDRYEDALDGSRSLFLQSDVDGFAAYRSALAEATRTAGDTEPARTIFARYLERLGQQVAYDDDLLGRPSTFDFTGHDVFTFDRKRAPRPRDLAAARALWRQELCAEYLQEKLNGSDDGVTAQRIVATLKRRHARQLETMKVLRDDAVLETYLDALAHVYDPHSDYLGHEEMESLSIALDLSLSGVGATLTSKDGACTIEELVPGGPAARSGRLEPGDRIAAVAQGDGDPVDVTDVPLTRIVELIRGHKGSAVTLTVLPPVGQPGGPRKVRLVRAEIKLEDQQAKARIVDIPAEAEGGGGRLRLGVIDLPSFYSDRDASDGKTGGGATADVARLLAKLKAERVQGVVLDLRRNGGGSLEEAVRLTGLFIPTGPIVQTRDFQGNIETEDDPDPAIAYDGPLVVLTSRFSASASEIAAGALQDYGRAVVVGDSATFGKGTVQTVTPLAPIMDRLGLGHSFDPGGLKVTVAKFYRPSGASTELRGVASDLVIPSPSEYAGVSESKLTDPLPWDAIAPAHFEREGRAQPYLGALRERSARRIAGDRAFSQLRAEVGELAKRLGDGTLSLNEAERRREMAAAKERRADIDKQDRAVAGSRLTYTITVKQAAVAGLPAPLVPGSAGRGIAANKHPTPPLGEPGQPGERAGLGDPDASSPEDDLIANEALLILRDYVRLVGAGRAPSPAASTSSGRGAG
jgi:carboxyl-terminal processing protease